jgi:hypothetical protein
MWERLENCEDWEALFLYFQIRAGWNKWKFYDYWKRLTRPSPLGTVLAHLWFKPARSLNQTKAHSITGPRTHMRASGCQVDRTVIALSPPVSAPTAPLLLSPLDHRPRSHLPTILLPHPRARLPYQCTASREAKWLFPSRYSARARSRASMLLSIASTLSALQCQVPWADRCLYPWVEAPSWRSSLKRHWGAPRHHFLCGASTVPVNSGHCPAPPPPPRASHHHYSPLRTPSQRRWPVVWATIAKFPSPIIAIVESSTRWVPSSLNPSIRFTASPSPSSHHPRRSLSSACWQRPGLRHAVRCGGAPLSPFGLLAWDRLAHLAGLARSQPRRQAGWPGLARQHSALPFSHSINLNDSNRFQT